MKSRTIPYTENNHSCFNQLQKITPQETTIYSDLTGTLLFQKENGFPENQKKALINFLNNKGRLIIVTGDDLAVVQEKFLTPLEYTGDNPIYLITGSGYSIDVYLNQQIDHFYTGHPIPSLIRERLLFSVLQQIQSTFNTSVALTTKEQEKLLSAHGFRLNLGERTAHLPATLHLEVRPNKITVFFFENTTNPEQTEKLLEELATNLGINTLIKDKKYIHITKGHNFIDIITSKKDQGIEKFNKILALMPNTINRKNIVLLGDSINDEGLFNYNYPQESTILKIFLGNNDDFFSKITASANNRIKVYLKNNFIAGSQKILETINNK